VELFSRAATWPELAEDLIAAIDLFDRFELGVVAPSLLIEVGDDFRTLRVTPGEEGHPEVILRLETLPKTTDLAREDGLPVLHGSVDRAISKAAAAMLRWTKDPETLELVEHQRYSLFLRWPGAETSPVNPYAYGLWDE